MILVLIIESKLEPMDGQPLLLRSPAAQAMPPSFAFPTPGNQQQMQVDNQQQPQATSQQQQQRFENAYPTPDISPEQVIEIQLDGMQHCDLPTKDHGIEIAFRFASPANKAATGPLSRFARMIHNPLYACMLNFKRAKFEPHNMRGDEWKISIVNDVNGQERTSVFIWKLSKQTVDPVRGCWMTDSVIKIS